MLHFVKYKHNNEENGEQTLFSFTDFSVILIILCTCDLINGRVLETQIHVSQSDLWLYNEFNFFSRNFDMFGRSDIGLYEETS